MLDVDEVKDEIKNVPEIQPENLSGDIPPILENTLTEKRGRGRPRKDGSKKTSNDDAKNEDAKELIETLEEITGDVLEFANSRLPNPKPVSQLEKKLISKGVKRVAEKYSVHLEKFGAEVMLGFGLLMFTIPRIKKQPEKPSDEIQ